MFLQNSINSIIIQNEKNPTHFTFYRSLHNIKTFPHNLIYTIELQYQIIIGVIDIFFVSLVFVKHRRIIIGTNLQLINRHFFKKFLYLLYNKGSEAYVYIIAFAFLKPVSVVFYFKFFKLKRHDVFLSTGPFLNALQIFQLPFDDEEKVDYEFIANLIFLWILFVRTVLRLRFNNRHTFQYFILVVVVFNVYTLYAGTLYTCRITALSHHKRSSSTALLASICFFLATLTIAARCYASKSATHSLAQLSSQPIFLSSIKDSKFQTYSSKIVLSRLFKSPKYKNTTSDISIIQKNSKYLLFTKNSKIQNSKSFAPHFRIRRQLDTSALKSFNNNFLANNQFIKRKADEHIRRKTFADKTWSNKSIRSDVLATLDYKIRQSVKKANHKSRELPSQNLKSEIYLGKLFKTSQIDINNNFPLKSIKQSDNIVNVSANATGGIDTWRDFPRRNDQRLVQPLTEVEDKPTGGSGIDRSMPPAHDHSNNSHSNESTVLVLVVTAVILTVALGLVTCVLSHYRGGTAADPHDAGQTPTTAPMLSVVSAGATAGVGGMDRLRSHGAALELATTRDRQVRLHAVHTDIAINLPPNITLPDGEDHPFTNSRLHIRDPEQESEIYQKCIKPPPNRTVLESESPPPYRSSSAGLLGSIGSSSSGSSDWSGGGAPLMMRCHSMSSTSKRPEAGHSGQKTDFIQRTVKIFTGKKSQPPPAPTLPVVVVPMRLRQNSDLNQNSSGRHKPSV